MGGGANRLSLIEAQAECLASPSARHWTASSETPDGERSIRLSTRSKCQFEADYGTTYADDPTTYYYWRKRDR